MIGHLRGKIATKSSEAILIDVNGVGYELTVPLSVLATLPEVGAEAALHVHTHVREDELRLFGFGTPQDRLAFRTMLKISGVGPKVAVAVLGVLSGGQLAAAVNSGDTARLTAVPGIGKKTAERIVLELGGKLVLEPGVSAPAVGAFGELASALKNLGFKPSQVEQTIRDLEEDGAENEKFEVLLRRALKALQGNR